MAPLTSVTPNTSYPELSKGSKGDQVLWLQEHLAGAISSQETTGSFGAQTTANLEAFQSAHGIPPSGVATAQTWAALLSLAPVEVDWTGTNRAPERSAPAPAPLSAARLDRPAGAVAGSASRWFRACRSAVEPRAAPLPPG